MFSLDEKNCLKHIFISTEFSPKDQSEPFQTIKTYKNIKPIYFI